MSRYPAYKVAVMGVSMVLGPDGEPVTEIIDKEGILYADIDLAKCVEPKQFHDLAGYYYRFDIFKLTVNRSGNRPIRFVVEEHEEPAERPTESEDIGSRVAALV